MRSFKCTARATVKRETDPDKLLSEQGTEKERERRVLDRAAPPPLSHLLVFLSLFLFLSKMHSRSQDKRVRPICMSVCLSTLSS